MSQQQQEGEDNMFKKTEPSVNVNEYAPKPRNNGEQLVAASDAMVNYCNQVAAHLENMGNEITDMAKELMEECRQTANNLREVGELEKRRTAAFYQRVRDAIASVQTTRKAFDMPYIESKATDETMDAVAKALAPPPPNDNIQ